MLAHQHGLAVGVVALVEAANRPLETLEVCYRTPSGASTVRLSSPRSTTVKRRARRSGSSAPRSLARALAPRPTPTACLTRQLLLQGGDHEVITDVSAWTRCSFNSR